MKGFWTQMFLGSKLGKIQEEAPAPRQKKPGDDRVIRNAPLQYAKADGKVIIEGCAASLPGFLEIPACIDGLEVAVIGSGAFYGHGEMTGLILPDTVRAIDRWAFRQCDGLRSLRWPQGDVTVGLGAFEGCGSLTELEIGANVTLLDRDAFKDCVNLDVVRFPDSERWPAEGGVTGLYPTYREAFGGCPKLTVYAPEGSFAAQYAKENGCRFLPLKGVEAPPPRRWTKNLWRYPGSGSVTLRRDGGAYFCQWSHVETPARIRQGEFELPDGLDTSRQSLLELLPPEAAPAAPQSFSRVRDLL